MPRPRAGGINKVVRRSKATGQVTHVDYYHRSTKLPLGRDEEEAKRRAAEIDGESPKRAVPPVTVFDGLVLSYLASDQYRALKPASRTLNDLYCRKLMKRFGGLLVAGITRPVVVAFREKLSKEIAAAEKLPPTKRRSYSKGEEGPMTRGVAKHLVNKLALVLSHGVDLGVLSANPAAKARAGFGVRARSTVWSPEQIRAHLQASPPMIRAAAAILLYTAQRPSDVTSMTWSAFKTKRGEAWISLRQQKTGELIDVPCHAELAAVLGAIPEEERIGLMLSSPTGLRWQYRNFARAWDASRQRADYRLARALFAKGIGKDEVRARLLKTAGVQRRDLRRTAMVRMAEAGATDAQIAAVSGHSIEQTRRILDVYIPRRGEVAAGAIRAWERLDEGRTPF